MCFFFKQKTAYEMRISDWSSDVCSSDLVIDPAGADPVAYDREHVIVLADHSAMSPMEIFRRLKMGGGPFNFQKQTLAGLLAGADQPLDDRIDWGGMRMDPTDISDVTG